MKRIGVALGTAAALAATAAVWFASHAGTAPASTFVLLDGTRSTTADLRGKVTLVNFWTTSCNDCVSEIDRIVGTYDRYHAKGFDTLAIAMGSDSATNVALFSETRRLPFKVAIDASGSLAKAWGNVDATPTTFLLDRHGAIVKRFVGQPDFDELQRLIEKLLAP
jgi:peroxiredoxin